MELLLTQSHIKDLSVSLQQKKNAGLVVLKVGHVKDSTHTKEELERVCPAFLTNELSMLCSCSEMAGPGCVDAHGRLSDNMFQASTHQAPRAVQSCALGVGEIFACCEELKSLQRFKLPQVGFPTTRPVFSHDSRWSVWLAVVCV